MGDPIGSALGILHGVFVWFQTLVPGGFGLYLIPILVLGVLTFIAMRKAT